MRCTRRLNMQTMVRIVSPTLALFCLVASCAQPFEGRVAQRLHQAGIPHGMADCMAKRWVDRLSVSQLRRIQSVTDDLKRERAQGRLTVVRLIERVRAIDDPEIFEVVSTSPTVCTVKI